MRREMCGKSVRGVIHVRRLARSGDSDGLQGRCLPSLIQRLQQVRDEVFGGLQPDVQVPVRRLAGGGDGVFVDAQPDAELQAQAPFSPSYTRMARMTCAWRCAHG